MKTILFVNPLCTPLMVPHWWFHCLLKQNLTLGTKCTSWVNPWPLIGLSRQMRLMSDDMWQAIFLNVKDDLMIDHKKYKLNHYLSLGQSMMYASRHPTVESGRKVIEGTTQKVRTHIFTTCLPPTPRPLYAPVRFQWHHHPIPLYERTRQVYFMYFILFLELFLFPSYFTSEWNIRNKENEKSISILCDAPCTRGKQHYFLFSVTASTTGSDMYTGNRCHRECATRAHVTENQRIQRMSVPRVGDYEKPAFFKNQNKRSFLKIFFWK